MPSQILPRIARPLGKRKKRFLFQKERLSHSSYIPPWMIHEHQKRYEFGVSFVCGKRVVDCACGEGGGARMFAAAGAASVDAFDVSSQALEKARRKSGGSGVRWGLADATCLPLQDNDADVYVSFETIEHVKDDERFLGEAVRILRRDGVFICSTPNRVLANPGRTIADKPWNRFHVREYSPAEFSALLKKYFEEVRLFGQNLVSRWRVRALRLLGKALPGHGAVLVGQILKLPRWIWDDPVRHAVREVYPGDHTEYMVAVCRGPRKRG